MACSLEENRQLIAAGKRTPAPITEDDLPLSKLVRFMDNDRTGRWANIVMGNGDPCWVGIAQTEVPRGHHPGHELRPMPQKRCGMQGNPSPRVPTPTNSRELSLSPAPSHEIPRVLWAADEGQ